MMTIQLDTVQFSDFAATGWVFEELKDWYSLSSDKTPNDERAQAHGSFDVATALRSSKALTWTAHYLAATERELLEAIEAATAAGAEGRVRMVVTDELRTSFRLVSVVNCVVDDHFGRPEAKVTYDVLARDPRRYVGGVWQQSPAATSGAGLTFPTVWPAKWPGGGVAGRVTLTNSGRVQSPPAFRIRGGFSSALITCVETGARLGFNRDIAATDYVLVDVRSKRALLNGDPAVDFSRFLQFREWEDVPKMSSRTYQLDATNPTGTAALEGRVDSAWL